MSPDPIAENQAEAKPRRHRLRNVLIVFAVVFISLTAYALFKFVEINRRQAAIHQLELLGADISTSWEGPTWLYNIVPDWYVDRCAVAEKLSWHGDTVDVTRIAM